MSTADVETIRRPALSKEIALYLGVAVATTLGHGGILALPFEVGAMVDGLKLDVAQAGLLASAGLVPFASVQFLLAEYSSRLPLRRVAVVGTLLIALASFLSATALSLWLFAGAQIVAGLGFGLVYGASSIAGVRARAPERAYGLGLGATTVAYAGLLAALPRGGLITQRFPALFHAHSGVFIVITAFALILLPFMHWIPAEPMVVDRGAIRPRNSAGRPWDSILATLVMVLFSVAVFCVYVYIERRGRALGVAPQTIGTAMSVMYVTSGVAGSTLAAIVGMRWGVARPLIIGLSLLAFTCLGAAASATPMQLWISVALNWFIWFFLYGYLFALSAALNPAGRLPALLGAMYLIAAALAATLGGLLLKFSSFAMIGWCTFAICILAAILAAPVGRTVDRLAHAEGT